MPNRDVVVIGASAGGIEALKEVCAKLPADLNAAVLVVLHTSPQSVLPELLNRAGRIPSVHPSNGERLEKGRIYVAPPDLHMIVEPGHIRTVRGPRENRHRPAIDPTFRSAALAYRNRVVGVVLTGMLDDGTSGLIVIRAQGGVAVVQDPGTALFPSMPESALHAVPDARVARLEDLPELLVQLTSEEIVDQVHARPGDALAAFETRMSELDMSEVENEIRSGEPSVFACPECGGVLWELDQAGLLRFRCRVGHAYTAANLRAEQRQAVETALWSGLRALEESASLYRRMANRAEISQHKGTQHRYEEQAFTAEANARTLRDFLLHVAAPQAQSDPATEAA